MMIPLLIAAAALSAEKLPLPAPGPVFMDYLAANGTQIWVPAGNTGKVFVLEAGKFREVPGFATKKGRGDRLMGPSSVSIGAGVAYVGNRGDAKICAFDTRTLEKKACSPELSSMPDGTFYVAPTKEVWVTLPREKLLQILDGATLKPVAKMELAGGPEGYAVDEGKGLVFTNLEDKDKTLAIDARARKIVSTFEPGCGEEGPRGLAVDGARGLLFVACTDGVAALDEKTGAKKGRLETGKGVDNIDYLPGKKRLYVASGQAEKLTLVDAADDGSLKEAGTAAIGKGCRVVVTGSDGTAYAADSQGGQLWVVKP